MAAHIIASRNLFIDSSADVGEGDNFTLQLGQESIRAMDGQQLRLSLLQFNMYSNFYQVNATNNKIKLTTSVKSTDLIIPSQNYETVGSIALAFANTVLTQVLADARTSSSLGTGLTASVSGLTATDVEPSTRIQPNGTGDRLLKFKVDFSAAHTLTAFRLQCLESEGESFALLGGDRITDSASTASSLTVSIASTTQLTVEGLYPMQRSTSPEIYLRCTLPNSNIESSSLSGLGPFTNHTMGSNILGCFQTQFEFVHYDIRSDQDFYMNLRTKDLNSLRLFLTDRKSRPLGRVHGSGSKSAAGPGVAQSTLGNLFFTCVLRIDTVQATIPRFLKAPVQPMPDLKKSSMNQLPA